MFNSQLIIIPSFISESDNQEFSPKLLTSVRECEAFIVENSKPARKFLKIIGHPKKLDEIEIFEISDKKRFQQSGELNDFLVTYKTIGLLSDSGSPCIADPGWKVVALAHQMGIQVRSLAGPGSIMQAIAASGLNGQNFVFHGYLPVNPEERVKTLKSQSKACRDTGYTQIYIETPYRNAVLFRDAIKVLPESLKLCIAMDINGKDEFIRTKTISEWVRNPVELQKIPCIFLIGI